MDSIKKLRELNLKETKKKVKDSVKQDTLIIQTINHIKDLIKVINILAKDLREWYAYSNPEFSRECPDHETFVNQIIKDKDKKPKDSMGADLSKENLAPIKELTKQIVEMYKFKEKQEKYLDKIMKELCPNMTTITGSIIGAKLIQHAGSLKRLILLPSSTVQLLGAEEALFRHIKTGARCPKYGVLHDHPLVSKAKRKEAGKAARILASKISIAARVDYAKGKFVGDKLMKEIEAKLK